MCLVSFKKHAPLLLRITLDHRPDSQMGSSQFNQYAFYHRGQIDLSQKENVMWLMTAIRTVIRLSHCTCLIRHYDKRFIVNLTPMPNQNGSSKNACRQLTFLWPTSPKQKQPRETNQQWGPRVHFFPVSQITSFPQGYLQIRLHKITTFF